MGEVHLPPKQASMLSMAPESLHSLFSYVSFQILKEFPPWRFTLETGISLQQRTRYILSVDNSYHTALVMIPGSEGWSDTGSSTPAFMLQATLLSIRRCTSGTWSTHNYRELYITPQSDSIRVPFWYSSHAVASYTALK